MESLKMDMTSSYTTQWCEGFWRSVEKRHIVQLPVLTDKGLFDDTQVVIRQRRERRFHDFDPYPVHGSGQCRDFITERYLRSAFDAHRLDQSIIDKTRMTRTRSNFVDKRTRSLDHAIEHQAVPWFSPPDAITHEVVTSVIDELVSEFDIKGLSPAPFTQVKYRKSAFSGLPYLRPRGDLGVYQDAEGKAKEQLRRAHQRNFSPMSGQAYVGLSRTQLADIKDPKIRLVWAVAFPSLLLQLSLWQPLYLHWLQTKSSRMHKVLNTSVFGMTLDEAASVTSRFQEVATNESQSEDFSLLITDWPAFDTGKICKVLESVDTDVYCHGVQPWELLFALTTLACGYMKHATTD